MVRYLHFDTGQQVWQQSWGSLFSGFQDRYPGSRVEPDLVTQTLPNIAEKAVATYAGGGSYELFYGHFTILAGFLNSGIIEPLDGYLSKDREVRVDDFFPAATERMKGKLYGIAWFTQGKELFYNASLLAEAGAPSPASWRGRANGHGRPCWTWPAR